MTREEEFLKDADSFRKSAFLIIREMVNMSSQQFSSLVDEFLHCIFFLGQINTPQYPPESIVSDKDMLNKLKSVYSGPFKLYSSQLPRRSPFSCVLDKIVQLIGQDREHEIIEGFQEFIRKLEEGGATKLISSTICVSQCDQKPDSKRYYGVSMSTSGCNPGRIVVAACCFHYWDSKVADAVMTYYPLRAKKTYFDGTLKLPEQVRCQAFSLSNGDQMPPCRSCGNLFGLKTSERREWAYGNCAEPESVSNLLKNEAEVRNQARQPSPTCTAENRMRATENVGKELKNCLRMLKFQWDENYYTPAEVSSQK